MDSGSARKRIEILGIQLGLPTVRETLGALEGEHTSGRCGGSGGAMDVHVYEPGDEPRLIDWKTSIRQGRPVMVEYERLSTSRIWLLMDVGPGMAGVCPSGEHTWQVVANVLRVFVALSLRRSDDTSLVSGDESSITRIPFSGGLAQFKHTLDKTLGRDWNHHRNTDALLEYARHIKDCETLIILVIDEHAMGKRHTTAIRYITRTHPMMLIDVATMNPLKAVSSCHAPTNSLSARRVSAFLRNVRAAAEVSIRRAYMTTVLEQELTRAGPHTIRFTSGESMFDRFIALVSRILTRTARDRLGTTSGLVGLILTGGL